MCDLWTARDHNVAGAWHGEGHTNTRFTATGLAATHPVDGCTGRDAQFSLIYGKLLDSLNGMNLADGGVNPTRNEQVSGSSPLVGSLFLNPSC